MAKDILVENLKGVAESQGLTVEQVIEALTEGLIAGCKRTHQVSSCRVSMNEDETDLDVFKQFLVVEEFDITLDKTYTQLLLEEAKALKKGAKVGDIIEIQVDPKEFSHYGMRDMKQKYREVMINHGKNNLYTFFKEREHEMLKAKVIDESPNAYRIDLGKETTLLPKTETLEKDNLYVGSETYVYVSSVELKSRGPKIYVTRKDRGLVTKLMEMNIPEIADGTIEVVGISRVPGERSKVGVRSNNEQVDPIGACVGENGSRIREIVRSLSGEKIDLFRWSDNEKELIQNALQPADVIAVTRVHKKEKSAMVIVPDDQLSLAIGKKGQNVKLAVQASGWSIDIKSEEMAADEGVLY